MKLRFALYDRYLSFEIWRVDIGDQAPFKPGVQAFFDFRYVLWRTIRSHDDLFLLIIESIKGMKELLLSPDFSSDELNVVDKKDIDSAVSFSKGISFVRSVPNSSDKLIHEALQR